MLTHVQSLLQASDGRYASDPELIFFQAYLASVGTRIRAYQKIQQAEQQIIAQVMTQLKTQRPNTFQVGGEDLTAKWQRDTVRVLRYSAIALLLDDAERFKETLLTWFQSIMRAFKTEENCHLTYTAMQAVIPDHLNPEELKLYVPILELCRVALGSAT
ncbi:MAG: phycobilisome protein [Cyanobacteria bacterium J06638_6]